MTVADLIKALKTMPQDVRVGVSAHDNSAWEIAGWVDSVMLFDKSDERCQVSAYVQGSDLDWYRTQPDTAVVLRS